MRFLFTTLQTTRASSTAASGAARAARPRGRAPRVLAPRRPPAAQQGLRAWCLPDLMAALEPRSTARPRTSGSSGSTTRRRCATSTRPTGPATASREAWCVERTVRHFRAIERLFDELRPDVVVPEVGQRDHAHRRAPRRARPRRHGPVPLLHDLPRPAAAVREHDARADRRRARTCASSRRRSAPRSRVHRAASRRKAKPIRAYRAAFALDLRAAARLRPPHRVRLTQRPRQRVPAARAALASTATLREAAAPIAARPLYPSCDPERPFVYFPLHVTDDYKIKRVIPHCVDQATLIEQVADALPHGYDIVLKEHPMSIGRNSCRDAAAPRADPEHPARRAAHELARADAAAPRRSS